MASARAVSEASGSTPPSSPIPSGSRSLPQSASPGSLRASAPTSAICLRRRAGRALPRLVGRLGQRARRQAAAVPRQRGPARRRADRDRQPDLPDQRPASRLGPAGPPRGDGGRAARGAALAQATPSPMLATRSRRAASRSAPLPGARATTCRSARWSQGKQTVGISRGDVTSRKLKPCRMCHPDAA